MKEKIGFIGLGLMGTSMATRLLKAGYQLFIFNRTKEKASDLISQGAVWCNSPAEVASQSEIIISMISSPSVLKEITLGKHGVLLNLQPGGIHIDCSTVSPEITKHLAQEYQRKGCYFLHSPVLGSVPQVMEGTLLLFVGGNKEAFKRVESILRNFGSKIWQYDCIEQATITKLLCNSFISGMVIVLAQALVLTKKADIDPRTFLEIISQSHLNSPMYQSKGRSIIERNFSPRFFVEHLFKDINLMLEVTESLQVPFPIGTIAQNLYAEAIQKGLAKEDYSAIIKILEAKAGINI